jgi:hypothetical protein
MRADKPVRVRSRLLGIGTNCLCLRAQSARFIDLRQFLAGPELARAASERNALTSKGGSAMA